MPVFCVFLVLEVGDNNDNDEFQMTNFESNSNIQIS